MSLTRAWQESYPNDENYGYELDDYQRQLRQDVRERLAAQHKAYSDETGKTDVGEHKPGECNVAFVGAKASFPTPESENSGCIAIATDESNQPYHWNGTAWVQGYNIAVTDLVPTGTILAFGGTSAPSGYLLCNGTAVSRTTYSTLFGVIGITYGSGDGSTTFNLPDLIGRVPVGEDSGGSRVSSNNLRGNASGAENHTLTISEMPSHHHGLKRDTDAFYSGENSGINNTGSVAWNTEDTGGGSAHNNMQPYQVVNYVIKM